jgi:hypothetical protein
MAYIKKIALNIDGTTIHSSLSMPFNCKKMLSLNSKCLDSLNKKIQHLQLIMLDEISLIEKKIIKFIDIQLRSIKHVHNKFFKNLDIIVIGDFYQV